MGALSGTATGCASTWKKDFKKPISISVCPPKLPVPHAHLLHNPVISPSDSKLSHTKLPVLRSLHQGRGADWLNTQYTVSGVVIV